MSEDRPLTEFAGDESAGNETEADDEPATDHADTATDQDAEPATLTYRCQPAGATCEACGATTERQWRDDGQFVCPDCKSW